MKNIINIQRIKSGMIMQFICLIIYIMVSGAPSFAADLVYFESPEGMKRLERSQAKINFFPLANHFESQENGVYCGVASSVIVLNTLRLQNPAITKPQDNSRLSKAERKYFPKDFDPIFHRYTQNALLNANTKSKMDVFGKPTKINGKVISDYGLQISQLTTLLKSYGLDVTQRVVSDSSQDEDFIKELIETTKTPASYVIINYSRKPLGQNGGGHYSPLGAYDKDSDSFLIMDVNPDNANWVWVSSADLIKAMRTFDVVENRGYVIVREGKIAN